MFLMAREADIKELLSIAGLNETGQEYLTDGRTGERFSRPVTGLAISIF